MDVTVDTQVNSESVLMLVLGVMVAAVFIILIAKISR